MTVDMGTVWDRTTEFLSDNLGAMAPVVLLAIFVPQVISGVIGQAGAAINPSVALAATFALLLPILWGQMTVTALAVDADSGRGAAQTTAARRLAHALLAMLILFVVLIALWSPISIALVASGIDLQVPGAAGAALSRSPGLAAFVGLYALFAAIVTIVISVRFTALLFAVIVAEGGVIAALRRAFALTRGIFWKTLGVLLLFGLVYGVAYLAATNVFGALFGLLLPDPGPFGVGKTIVAILVGLLATTYSVVVSAFTAKLYRAVTAGAAIPA